MRTAQPLIETLYDTSISGVFCNSDTSSAEFARVTFIFVGTPTNGTLPLSIGNFRSLYSLTLYGGIRGTIPSTIGALTSLAYLHFSKNSFTGTIPSAIGALKSLNSLNLGVNSLTGTIPSFIIALTSLTSLSLGVNSLTGTIPSFIIALTSLTSLSLHSNSLTGTIPSIVELKLLNSFSSCCNSLTGTIPSNLSAMKKLLQIALYSNFLTGTIPSNMSALSSLGYVRFDNNYLTMGTATTVPTSTFSSYTLSSYLNLSSNCLAFHTDSPYRHVTATHCRRTSKYQIN